jgi:hypothetical protein
MTGYLVWARCFEDDLPMSLHATLDDAREGMEALTVEDVQRVACDSFGLDVSDVLFADIVLLRPDKPPCVVEKRSFPGYEEHMEDPGL